MAVTKEMVISACMQQNLAKLNEYKNLGVDFNKIRNSIGDTLLHLAILNNKPKTFEALLDLGMDLNLTSLDDGTSPLTFSILEGKSDFFQVLINRGVDINHIDADGWTPLNTALLVEKEFPQIVNTLLNNTTLNVNIPFVDKPPISISETPKIIEKIATHPSFDPTYNLLLLDSFNYFDLEKTIRTHHSNIDESILYSYNQAKILGYKLDFDGCFTLNHLSGHEFECFEFEGAYNEKGLITFLNSYDGFYNQAIQSNNIPEWAFNAFSTIHSSLTFSAKNQDAVAYLNKIKNNELLIIPSGWDEHSVFLVIHNNKLYRCNRGEESDTIHGIEEFIITKPAGLTEKTIQKLLDADGSHHFLQTDIINILGLQKIGAIKAPTQTVGNCTWTSLEAALEASFVDSFIDQGIAPTMARYYAKQTFHIWEDYDQLNEIANVIENKDLLIKNEIYDDLLLKALQYHHEADNLSSIQKGTIILTQVHEPSFHDAFKTAIANNINKYYPGLYNDISYMKNDYPLISYYDYLKSWSLYLKKSNASEYQKTKEYFDFLQSCDKLNSQADLTTIALHDVINKSVTQSLEHLFSSNEKANQTINNSMSEFEVVHLDLWKNIISSNNQFAETVLG